MGPRKSGGGGGGGKKKGAKKRKSNVWDDYTAPAKRGRSGGEDSDVDGASSGKRAKRESKESMFGQWKKQKQQFQKKKRTFVSTVEQKKQEQRAQYLALKQRQADALYDGVDATAHLTKKQRKQLEQQQRAAAVQDNDNDSASDSYASSDSDNDEQPSKVRRRSVFDQFVQTFQPAAGAAVTAMDSGSGEEDDEYEEVLVNEHGEEIDGDGNVIERSDDDDDGDDDGDKSDAEDATTRDAALADDEDVNDEEDDDDEDDANDDATELAQDEDPYRRRFVLTTFDERDAAAYDALPKKFEPLAPVNAKGEALHFASPSEYSTTYRRGLRGDGKSDDDDSSSNALVPVSSKMYIRSRLLSAWRAKQIDPETLWSATSLEYALLHQLSAYNDVFYAAQTYESTATLRRLSAMHVLNHVLKVRDTVTRNSERLRKREASGGDEGDDREYRDQGFSRATVLVLLPLRSAALAFVKLLLEHLPASVDTFHNKDRFMSEYGSASGDDESETETDTDGLHEWQKVFAEGNNDDCFQLGLSLSRKALRFYSAYQNADIIIASPLGLRQQLGDEVVELDDADAAKSVRLSTDCLSSIEVCVVDSASLILMQNMEHLRHVVRALNVQPKDAPHADFSRMREWNLASLGAYFRQTVVFAHGVEPALQSLVTKCCKNTRGTIKYARVYDPADGSASIARVVPQVKQIFQRIDVHAERSLSARAECELRFAYFCKHVFEPLLDHPKKHVLIFIPSYLDYVRVRNLFNDSMNKKLIRSVQCCEYTTNKQVSRARTSFFHGKAHVLLVTERFHFYHQYVLRGVHQLIWYGLPQMGDFYPEMLNMLASSSSDGSDVSDDVSKSSVALFTRLDLFRMQRIVGNKRAERMCQPKATKPTFLFC